jgi:uncharacterized membrane protein YphA (DoxX/SURF4 family)
VTTTIGGAQIRLDNWFVRNQDPLRTTLRVILGVVLLIDGSLKFQPGFVAGFSVPSQTSPAWLDPWFSFWSSQVSANTALWVYMTGAFELGLGLALFFGFLRKVAYSLGIVLMLLIWAVPESFGAPYGPTSTDIGTGVVYAMLLLALLLFDAMLGPGRYSLDGAIVRRWPGWARVSEVQSARPALGMS